MSNPPGCMGQSRPEKSLTARSAAGVTWTDADARAVLFGCMGSRFSPPTEKLVVSVPAAAASGVTTSVAWAVWPAASGPRSAVICPSANEGVWPWLEPAETKATSGGRGTRQDRIGLVVRPIIRHVERVGDVLADVNRSRLGRGGDRQVADAPDRRHERRSVIGRVRIGLVLACNRGGVRQGGPCRGGRVDLDGQSSPSRLNSASQSSRSRRRC